MINRKELKTLAKEQLKGNWATGAIITLIFMVLSGAVNYVGYKIDSSSTFLSIFVTYPIAMGMSIAYVNLVKNKQSLQVGDMFKGFKIFGKSVGIALWMFLWTFLWTLLFIIPGIIKGIAYSQSTIIIANDSRVNVKDALKLSMKMTKGHKWDIFVMQLSFIGWGLLVPLTLGLGVLWLTPYISATMTNMFYKLKEESIMSGVCTEEEFTGAQAVA